MGLSEWPEHFRDNRDDELVIVEFEDEMLVLVETDKAIGLTDDDGPTPEVVLWLPKSQIHDDIPSRGEWIESIQIPEWLAEDKGLS